MDWTKRQIKDSLHGKFNDKTEYYDKTKFNDKTKHSIIRKNA